MAELTRAGLVPYVSTVAGVALKTYPVKEALQRAMVDPIVSSALQPLPKPASSSSSRSGPYDQAPRLKPAGKGDAGSKPKGKGKGKSWGKSGKQSKPLPAELQGLRMSTKAGARYCWPCNMAEGCGMAKFGGTCKNGFHGCMRCGMADHGASSCTRKAT